MITTILTAAIAAIVATFITLIVDHHTRTDLQDRIFDLERDLQLTKDLVETNRKNTP